jgi:hypothetical protein
MFINRFSTRTIVLVITAIALMTLLTMNAYLEQRRGEGIARISAPQANLDHDHNAQLVSQAINPDTYYPLPPGKQTDLVNAGTTDPQVLRDLAKLRQATTKYHDVNIALADGFILPPASECVQDPQAGVMGLHVINPARLMDPVINILEPEILLYVKSGNDLKLLGVEYFYGIGKPGSELKDVPQPYPPSPIIFGRPLDGPMEKHEPDQPPHYDLHVWLWQANPSGIFAPFNPTVSCE